MISKELLKRYGYNLNTAYEAVFINKFCSILTVPGIIFGVGTVIPMMGIGSGAQQEIPEQMKIVGVNNIVITPVAELSHQTGQGESGEESEGEGAQLGLAKFSPGLNMMDVESIVNIIPDIDRVSPEVVYTAYVIKDGVRRSATFSGVLPDFFEMFGLELEEGKFFGCKE